MIVVLAPVKPPFCCGRRQEADDAAQSIEHICSSSAATDHVLLRTTEWADGRRQAAAGRRNDGA